MKTENAECPYCQKDLDVIEVAIANLEANVRPNNYCEPINAMTLCCGKIIRLSARVILKYNIQTYSEESMPECDSFGNELGKPIVRN